MIISTTDSIPGKKVSKILGIARGNTVQSRWFGSDIAAALKNIIGGELKGYTELLTRAREESLQRMIDDAKKMKADAVINIRFITAHMMGNATELLAYGTAVKLS